MPRSLRAGARYESRPLRHPEHARARRSLPAELRQRDPLSEGMGVEAEAELVAADPPDRLEREIEPDAAAGEEIGGVARGEAGDEEEREQRRIVGGVRHLERDRAGRERARAHVGDVDAGAVVLDAEAEAAAPRL